MKYIIYFILLISLAALSGCGSGFANPQVQKYPQFSSIHKKYNSEQVSSFKLNVNCSSAEISGLNEEFIRNYCPMLEKDIRSFIHAHNPTWQDAAEASDIEIFVEFEVLHGSDYDG